MSVAVICDAFDWDYDTYKKQPKWFIERRLGKRRLDNEQLDKSKPKR